MYRLVRGYMTKFDFNSSYAASHNFVIYSLIVTFLGDSLYIYTQHSSLFKYEIKFL